jgi:hypothetical protein
MGAGREITDKIRFEERELADIEERRKNARSVDASKNMLLELEKQKSYIKGLKEALTIIERQ